MKKGRITNVIQRIAIFLCVALVVGAIPWVDAGMVQAENREQREGKAERCTLDSVTLKISDNTAVFTGGLEPYPVEEEIGWNALFASFEVDGWEYTKSEACVDGYHYLIDGKINTAGSDSEKESEWQTFLEAPDYTTHNYIRDGVYDGKVSENSLYYDVNFQFHYFVDEQTPEGITVRFARAYDIAYDLAGGAFGETKLDRYTAGAQYKIPVPTRAGYEFGGWTGTGLAEPTKEVVLPIGTTGDRSYKATWKKVESTPTPAPTPTPGETPKPEPKPEPEQAPEPAVTPENDNLSVGAKVEDKKGNALYVVTKSTEKVIEVAYAAPAKKAKKVTIPATITLEDGQKAKVTAISANAFKNNKTVQTVIIGKNVKSIGKKAFYKCKNLKTIKINSSKLTLKKVGSKAFAGISKKAVITVPTKKYKSYKTILKKRGIGKKVTVKKKK